METKADLDEVLLLLFRVVLASLGVDDSCVCVGRIVSSFGFVGEVRAWKERQRRGCEAQHRFHRGATKGQFISQSKLGSEGQEGETLANPTQCHELSCQVLYGQHGTMARVQDWRRRA